MHILDVPRANVRVFHNGDWSGDAKLVLDPDGREPLQFKIPAAVLLTLGKEAALAFARSALIYQVEDVEDVLRPADVVEMIEHIRWPEQVEGAIGDRDIKPDNVSATRAVDPRDEELFTRYLTSGIASNWPASMACQRALEAVTEHRKLFPLPPTEKPLADEPRLFILREVGREQRAEEGSTGGGMTDWHNVTKDGWPESAPPEVSTDAAKVAVMLDLAAAPTRYEEGVVQRLVATGHAEEVVRAAINELIDEGHVARETNRLRRVQK